MMPSLALSSFPIPSLRFPSTSPNPYSAKGASVGASCWYKK